MLDMCGIIPKERKVEEFQMQAFVSFKMYQRMVEDK
jgi:hypothetical protein